MRARGTSGADASHSRLAVEWGARIAPSDFPRDAIDVWAVPLDSPTQASRLDTVLSPDERARAARFHFEADRRRFTCARGALRCLLAAYLHSAPSAVTFAAGPRGKPMLAGPGAGAVSFNVSHSGDLALIAVAAGDVDVGVDVEHIRPLPDADAIACRFFAPAEVAAWRALPHADREAAFFRCWTRKEAYVKALGDGLARPLDGFEVTFGLEEPPTLRVIGDDRESHRWTLASLAPRPDYAAALVATRGFRRIRCWSWIVPEAARDA